MNASLNRPEITPIIPIVPIYALEIGVFCLPNSTSSDDGARLGFTSADPALKNVDGDIVMRSGAKNTPMTFRLLSETISWKSGKYAGTHQLRFGPASASTDTILQIYTDSTKKVRVGFGPPPAVFTMPQLAKDGLSISTCNANNDVNDYFYQLSAGFMLAGGFYMITTDPRIKNNL